MQYSWSCRVLTSRHRINRTKQLPNSFIVTIITGFDVLFFQKWILWLSLLSLDLTSTHVTNDHGRKKGREKNVNIIGVDSKVNRISLSQH